MTGMFKEPDTLADQAQLGARPPVDDRLAGIPIDEPIFILRASDMLAAPMVKHWCDVHALNPRCPPAMLAAARKIGLQMDQWPDRKWPG